MAINLEDHKIFIKDLNMEVVPYSVAIQAMQELEKSLEEVYTQTPEINSRMEEIKNAFEEISKALSGVNMDIDLERDDKN